MQVNLLSQNLIYIIKFVCHFLQAAIFAGTSAGAIQALKLFWDTEYSVRIIDKVQTGTICKPPKTEPCLYREYVKVMESLCFSTGAVDNLIQNLHSQNSQVRGSAAVALGYLTFNSTAARLLLSACRNMPGLFDSLKSNLGHGKLCMAFVDEWQRNVQVGLPCNRYPFNQFIAMPVLRGCYRHILLVAFY